MSEKREKLNKVIVNAVDEELKRIFGETTPLRNLRLPKEQSFIKARKDFGKNRIVFSRP